MHLKVSDELAKTVKKVLLNGKAVHMPIEFDTDEGWVEYYEPKLVTQSTEMLEKGTALESLEDLELEVMRKYGKVEVIF